MMDYRNKDVPPFQDGELVVATHPATLTPNHPWPYGSLHRVRCEWKEWYNKHHKCWVRMWYVGVIGYKNGECWYAPYLFSSIITGFKAVEWEEIKETEEELCAN